MHEEEHNIHLEYSKRSSIEELDTVVSSDMRREKTPKENGIVNAFCEFGKTGDFMGYGNEKGVFSLSS